MKNKIQRNNSMDLLRVMASMAVVIIHVSTAPVGSATTTVAGGILKNLELIHILMQWSVPVFFMITGFCMMQKETCTYSYCFSKVLKYIVTLFTVGLFYSLLEGVFIEKTISLNVIVNAFKSVVSGYTWEHMWFVYSIIGVYLVIPVLHCFMKQGNTNIIILTTLLLFFSILIPAISKNFPFGVELPIDGYLVYVCFGGMIAKCTIDKKWKYLSLGTIVLSIVYLCVNVGKQLFVFKHPIVCFMAMGIFLLISHADFKSNKMILEIAKCSWGIYLIHPFFMNIALKVLKIDLFSGMLYIKLFIFAIVLFVISLITTYILRKIPVIKTIF
ncbi:MAG: acyltransferase family protein [Lachnospiraceae bacterium]|nr:acyltransferase family protein [Lachnospiraceae bacterium]